MACTGSYCANHCYNNACAGKYRAPRSGNVYTFPDLGNEPTANFTNQLKIALNQEISERNAKLNSGISSVSFTNVVPDSSIIAKTNTEVLVELKNKINSMEQNLLNDSYAKGTIIKSSHWSNIRDKILQLMRECLCHSDCGSHAVCACYGDCGCNYSSDKRLKNIKANEVVKDINDFNKIKSKKWSYKDNESKMFYGPIAQDILELYPDAVEYDEYGFYKLNAISIIGVLWSALNKSIDKINELEERVKILEDDKAEFISYNK